MPLPPTPGAFIIRAHEEGGAGERTLNLKRSFVTIDWSDGNQVIVIRNRPPHSGSGSGTQPPNPAPGPDPAPPTAPTPLAGPGPGAGHGPGPRPGPTSGPNPNLNPTPDPDSQDESGHGPGPRRPVLMPVQLRPVHHRRGEGPRERSQSRPRGRPRPRDRSRETDSSTNTSHSSNSIYYTPLTVFVQTKHGEPSRHPGNPPRIRPPVPYRPTPRHRPGGFFRGLQRCLLFAGWLFGGTPDGYARDDGYHYGYGSEHEREHEYKYEYEREYVEDRSRYTSRSRRGRRY
ncbi:hypothetical protein F5Y14DRAFT_453803 [Nemania sp. NC0429]|nr:hypothetical protein F5Y14DRAFT_453803 [Nemania sp. NC0429]